MSDGRTETAGGGPPPAARWRSRLAAALRTAAREPLAHFVVIGLLVFAVTTVARDNQRPAVSLSAGDIGQLAAFWRTQTQRPPTPAELKGLIRDRVDEEILYREAVRLGLDRDDIIIRRRLAQKLAFLSQDLATIPEPTERELRAFHARNPAAWAAPASVTFEQIYFSPDSRGAATDSDARAALAELTRSGDAVAGTLGDPFMLPSAYAEADIAQLQRDYGAAFATAVGAAPVGRWSGPLRSAYGLHLVRVAARRSALAPPYAAVRDRVREAWTAEKRKAANAAWMADLRRRYRVSIDGTPVPDPAR